MLAKITKVEERVVKVEDDDEDNPLIFLTACDGSWSMQ